MRHFLAASAFRKEQDTHGQPFLLASFLLGPWREGERPKDESMRPSRRVEGAGLPAVATAVAARLEALLLLIALSSRFELRWGRKLPFEEDVGVDERRLGALLGPALSFTVSTASTGTSGGSGSGGGAVVAAATAAAGAGNGGVVLGLFGKSLSGVPRAAICLETL